MKNILLLCSFCTILFATGLQAQESQANAIDKYFQQYVDDENFTVVYISSKLFQMLGKLDVDNLPMNDDEDAKALMDLAKDMRGLRILTTEVDVDRYYKEAKAKINTKNYEVLMTVRSTDGDNFEFLVLEEGDKIQELLMLGGGDEFILMSFVGNLDLNKISRLAKEMEK